VQMVAAGLRAIYVSGWQCAADANDADRCIPTRASTLPTPSPTLCGD